MKVTWHILKSPDEDFIRQVALANGWKERKVQLRKGREHGKDMFYMEPYEKDCRCPNIVQPPPD